ncbi:MAG TPA: bifunctional serine/threonine-protein kinase/formylglycine-generating enzyme family protein [Bryobacteraceae bacterium]|jgi:serine/threonine protein kinase
MNPADEPIPLREIWPPGTLIKGDFVIEKRLGGGGFGTVYIARNRFLGSTNVIKRLHENFASDPDFVRKFVNEGRAIRRLRGCPHIVEVEQMTQTEDGHLVLVMEYVPGGDLAHLMDTRTLSPAEVIEFGRQIATGLESAHQAGLVHRDIKPQNILVGEDSTGKIQLKLIDFGIAADHSSNNQTSVMRSGSIGFAAPEQWARAGKDLDGRTDLYALGATLYRMLTGQMPYPDVLDVGSFFSRSLQGPPKLAYEVRPDVPFDLAILIQDLLAVQVENRPPSAAQVIRRLEAMQQQASRTPSYQPTVFEQALSMSPPPPQPPQAPPSPARAVTHLEPPRPSPVPYQVPFAPMPPAQQASPVTGARRWPWLIATAAVAAVSIGGWLAMTHPTVKPHTAAPPAARDFPRINPKDGLTYMPIPSGNFQMGCSPRDTECSPDEAPHFVEITNRLWMSKTEVTQAAYARVTGQHPGLYKGDDLPVEQVNVDEAQRYCSTIGGRLPTEAEWEYAARGGNPAARYGNLDDIAWYTANAGRKNHPVAEKAPNGYGLYDMLGNVWEWTADHYGKDYFLHSEVRDPQGPGTGAEQVLRGGNWDYRASVVRASYRGRVEPSYRSFGIGFRCLWNQP